MAVVICIIWAISLQKLIKEWAQKHNWFLDNSDGSNYLANAEMPMPGSTDEL